jgi:hypothetical protein
VARYDADGGRTPTNIFEAAAWHWCVVAKCRRCDREAIFDPHAAWWLFERKGWDDNLRDASRRFRCTTCQSRAIVTFSRTKEPNAFLPMPSARDWKRAVNRFRS